MHVNILHRVAVTRGHIWQASPCVCFVRVLRSDDHQANACEMAVLAEVVVVLTDRHNKPLQRWAPSSLAAVLLW